jgi:hypothetical protein
MNLGDMDDLSVALTRIYADAQIHYLYYQS